MSQAFLVWKGIRRTFLRSGVPSFSSSSRHLSFALQRELDVLLRRLLCLLDEAVQKDHMAIAHAEHHPRGPVAIKVASYLPQAVSKRSTMRTPDWPAKLYLLNVLPYRLAVFGRQFQNPFADRIAAGRADIEPCGELFRSVNSSGSPNVPFLAHFCKLFRSLLLPQLRPVIQPFANLALEAAIGRVVKSLPAKGVREIVLSGKGFRRVVIVFVT